MGESEQINVVISELEHDEWYSDIVYYLKNLSCPNHLVDYKRRDLRLKAMKYCLTEDGLGWKNPDGVLLRCVNQEEAKKIIGGITLWILWRTFRSSYYFPQDPEGWILLANTLF
jgi:hypothetical protein